MNSHRPVERLLTELDHARLNTLARQAAPSPASQALADLLLDADTVPSRDMPAHIVTMYSQVRVRDCHTGAQSKLVICYPADADAASGFVSVLSPAGRGLLGLSPGGVAQWATPDGATTSVELLEILFQPEASGDYEM
ncbi:MAG: GreA/GreB family elongation factor [Ramlibacter sp.]